MLLQNIEKLFIFVYRYLTTIKILYLFIYVCVVYVKQSINKRRRKSRKTAKIFWEDEWMVCIIWVSKKDMKKPQRKTHSSILSSSYTVGVQELKIHNFSRHFLAWKMKRGSFKCQRNKKDNYFSFIKSIYLIFDTIWFMRFFFLYLNMYRYY